MSAEQAGNTGSNFIAYEVDEGCHIWHIQLLCQDKLLKSLYVISKGAVQLQNHAWVLHASAEYFVICYKISTNCKSLSVQAATAEGSIKFIKGTTETLQTL